MTFTPAGTDNEALREVARQAKGQTRLFVATLAVAIASLLISVLALVRT